MTPFRKTGLNGNGVEPVFIHNAFSNIVVHFNAFPMLILKRWPCYLMEPKKVENHSKIIRKHLGNVFKCLQNVSMFLRTVCHVFA